VLNDQRSKEVAGLLSSCEHHFCSFLSAIAISVIGWHCMWVPYDTFATDVSQSLCNLFVQPVASRHTCETHGMASKCKARPVVVQLLVWKSALLRANFEVAAKF